MATLVGCGGADSASTLHASSVTSTTSAPSASGIASKLAEPALTMYEFGPAFGATMGWDAYAKSPDAGCTDAIAQVNQARKGLAADVQWSSVTGLLVWEETGMSWGAYRAAGCSTIGKQPDEGTSEPEGVPPPTRCDGLRGDVSHGWQIITSTAPYQALVNNGAMGAVEEAFTAALSSQCIH